MEMINYCFLPNLSSDIFINTHVEFHPQNKRMNLFNLRKFGVSLFSPSFLFDLVVVFHRKLQNDGASQVKGRNESNRSEKATRSRNIDLDIQNDSVNLIRKQRQAI